MALDKVKDNDRQMRDAYADKIYSVYGEASQTGEVIGGAFAKDFAGEVKWSRALDFEVAGMPQFKGIRYIDYKDCTNIHVLFKDGESKSFLDLSTEEMERVVKSLERKLETSGKKVASKGKKPWYQGF